MTLSMLPCYAITWTSESILLYPIARCTKVIYIGNIAIVFPLHGSTTPEPKHVWSDTFKGMQISRLKKFYDVSGQKFQKLNFSADIFHVNLNLLQNVDLNKYKKNPSTCITFFNWPKVKFLNFPGFHEYSVLFSIH